MSPRASRIVVADDSRFMGRLLSSALEEAGFEVVALAADGDEALAACERLHPDALSLDLAMPGKNGLDVLRELRRAGSPIPVVVVSAFSPAFGAHAVDALAEGAFELVAKPAAGDPLETFLSELAQKMNMAANRERPRRPTRAHPGAAPSPNGVRATPHTGRARTVVIACSTGGPQALTQLVPKLPGKLGAGTLIVQHMPPGFTGSLAERLNNLSALSVQEAAGGEKLEPGRALLAPGGRHLRLVNGTAKLSDEPAIGGLRPRADLTIAAVAAKFGPDVLLVVLTGMGKDGLEGAREVKKNGGRVLAEAEASCVVYGMPRAVVEENLADQVLELRDLPAAIAREARG